MAQELYNQKIEEIEVQVKKYITEIKGKLTLLNQQNERNMLSYFTYSFNISHDHDGENLCLGSFHIMNIGNQPITNPFICIKLPKESPFVFSGKYVYKNSPKNIQNSGGWERLNDKDNKEEIWLKPLEQKSIAPNEMVSFSNFQIKWKATDAYAGSILGYTYSDQSQDGVPVLNPINLSGIVTKQEDDYGR